MFEYSAESTLERSLSVHVRQVVEAHAGAEVADPRAAGARLGEEALELQVQVALEQGVVAGHGRVGGVHQRVPVDLVQPDRRVAPELAARGAVDRVADLLDRRCRQLQRLAGAVGVHETIDDLGVEDEVLAAGRAAHRVHPAGRVGLAVAGLGHVRRAADEPLGKNPRAVVVAGGAGVAVHRGDGVGEQEHRVRHRLDAAAAHACSSRPARPSGRRTAAAGNGRRRPSRRHRRRGRPPREQRTPAPRRAAARRGRNMGSSLCGEVLGSDQDVPGPTTRGVEPSGAPFTPEGGRPCHPW